MSKTIRIRTTPGGADKQINIDLNQDFDFIEILSLKLAQADLYNKFCANYGTVVGRVIANDGFGVPNVKVSLFIPIDEFDENNSLIKSIYPYKSPTDKDSNGVRYNLLPDEPVDECHVPVGTFPSKQKVTDSNVMLYIYEKYFKFTTITNSSGDYMIFGLPLGEQTLHFDIDYSDIGFTSLRPYDLIDQGASPNMFPARSLFGYSKSLDNLPQIESANLPVMVTPFWGDEDNCDVGVSRIDLTLKRELTPSAFFFGSLFTDGDSNVVNKSGRPNRKLGRGDQLETGAGSVEMIYRDIYGNVQSGEDIEIDDNGNWASMIPLNLANVITAEDGTLIPSGDPAKGIPTEVEARFRIGFVDAGLSMDKSTTAKFLVPNMFGNYNFRSISANDPSFNDHEKYSPVDGKYGAIFPLKDNSATDVSDPGNKLRDFVTMRWKKIYTVRQYIARYQRGGKDGNENYIGIKSVEESGGNNPFPFNRSNSKANPLLSFICVIFSILLPVILIINTIAQFIALIMIAISKLGISIAGTGDKCCQMKVKQTDGMFHMYGYPVNRYGSPIDRDGKEITQASMGIIHGVAGGSTGSETYIGHNQESWFGGTSNKGWMEIRTLPWRGLGNSGNVDSANPVSPDVCIYDTIKEDDGTEHYEYDDWTCKCLNSSSQNEKGSWSGDLADAPGFHMVGIDEGMLMERVHLLVCRGQNDNKGAEDCIPGKWGYDDKSYWDATTSTWKNGYTITETCKFRITRVMNQSSGSLDPSDSFTITNDATEKKAGKNDGWLCSHCMAPDNDCPKWLPLIPLRCVSTDDDYVDTEDTHANTSSYPVLFRILGCSNICRSSIASGCAGLAWEDVEIKGEVRDCLGHFMQCFIGKLGKTLDIMDFDFYNDWVNGSLYAFKFKSKTKVKRRRGIIYSKFPDLNCIPSGGSYQDFKENYEPGEEFGHMEGTYEPEHGKNICKAQGQIEEKKEYISNHQCQYYLESSDKNACLRDHSESTCNVGCPCYNVFSTTRQFDGAVIREYEGNQYYGALTEDNNSPEWMSGRPRKTQLSQGVIYSYDTSEPKKYMLYPTDITQVGSSVICDIDESAYIIDKLPRTSYAKEEELGKYGCLACVGSKCISTRLFMLHSQVGVGIDFVGEVEKVGGVWLEKGQKTVTEFDYELRREIAKNFRTFPNYDTKFDYIEGIDINHGDGIYKATDEYTSVPPSFIPYFDFNAEGLTTRHKLVSNTAINTMKINNKFLIGHQRQTPYYFYFGIRRGATALDKLRRLYFDGCADNAIL